MKRQKQRKFFGQCIAEYVIIFSAVSVAVFLMLYYMRGGIQRVIRIAADEAGNREDAVKYFENGEAATNYIQPSLRDFSQNKTEQAGGIQTIEFQDSTHSLIEDGRSVAKEVID